MDVKIRKLETRCQGDKWQRVPFAIDWTCSKCGAEHTTDYSQKYLSYPIWGESKKVHLYCDTYEHEQSIHLKVDVTLTVEK